MLEFLYFSPESLHKAVLSQTAYHLMCGGSEETQKSSQDRQLTEWESNAAKHVSMASQLSEVSSKILDWRKLELSCWKQCLDNVFVKQSKKANKWWFHIYQLIQATCQQEETSEDSDSEEKDLSEVMRTLKEFMERSNLGEFEARLGMLKSFHCQSMYLCTEAKEGGTQSQGMMNLLWNL
ncbi:midasin-like [Saccostrea cucullata]|uniref:midasin-like n=1 Tax=Saccostrea cuccullata TaxID=36930 RepID=UPI002ED0BD35